MASKVTLASLDQKLESFMAQVVQHMDQDNKMFDRIANVLDGNGKPGLKTRIEVAEGHIEEIQTSRGRQAKAVWSTLVAVVGAIIISFFTRH